MAAAPRMSQNLELAEANKKDKVESKRALKRLTTLVAKHAKEGKEILEMISTNGPRATAKPGEIRKEIYATGAIHPQSESRLASLPAEVIHRATTYLPLAATVALSLTCKSLAARADAARSHAQILYTNDQRAKDIARGKPSQDAAHQGQGPGAHQTGQVGDAHPTQALVPRRSGPLLPMPEVQAARWEGLDDERGDRQEWSGKSACD